MRLLKLLLIALLATGVAESALADCSTAKKKVTLSSDRSGNGACDKGSYDIPSGLNAGGGLVDKTKLTAQQYTQALNMVEKHRLACQKAFEGCKNKCSGTSKIEQTNLKECKDVKEKSDQDDKDQKEMYEKGKSDANQTQDSGEKQQQIQEQQQEQQQQQQQQGGGGMPQMPQQQQQNPEQQQEEQAPEAELECPPDFRPQTDSEMAGNAEQRSNTEAKGELDASGQPIVEGSGSPQQERLCVPINTARRSCEGETGVVNGCPAPVSRLNPQGQIRQRGTLAALRAVPRVSDSAAAEQVKAVLSPMNHEGYENLDPKSDLIRKLIRSADVADHCLAAKKLKELRAGDAHSQKLAEDLRLELAAALGYSDGIISDFELDLLCNY